MNFPHQKPEEINQASEIIPSQNILNNQDNLTENIANNTHQQNFFNFDFQDGDLFNGINNNPSSFAQRQSFSVQNTQFFEAPGNSHVFLPPKKYEYLGQKEEQIYQDSKSVMFNIPDFDFHSPFFQDQIQNRNFNQISQQESNFGNQQNPSSIQNNLLFSTFRRNSEVNISDLFPVESGPKLEHPQYFENEYEQPQQREQSSCLSFSHSASTIPIQENQIFPYPSHRQFNLQQNSGNFQQQNNNFQQQQHYLNTQSYSSTVFSSNSHQYHSQSNQPKRMSVFSIVKDQLCDRKKDYDKNICRYITRQVVRSFASSDFKNRVLTIIADIYPDTPSHNIIQVYKDVTEYFLGEIENLSGFRALKEVLLINPEVDGSVLATQKRIFRSFMKWYLKERYFRSVLNGNMNDKLAFIKYKNKIMLHYINKPHKWNSNKKKLPAINKSGSNLILSKLEY